MGLVANCLTNLYISPKGCSDGRYCYVCSSIGDKEDPCNNKLFILVLILLISRLQNILLKLMCLKVCGGNPCPEIEGNNNVSHISANILTNTAKKILDVSGAD